MPYITHIPEINTYELTLDTTTGINSNNNEYVAVVLASDGLWDIMKNREVGQLTSQFINEQMSQNESSSSASSSTSISSNKRRTTTSRTDLTTTSRRPSTITNPAELLLWRALQTVAPKYGYSLSTLLNMPKGKSRRQMIDDITIGVLVIKIQNETIGSETTTNTTRSSSSSRNTSSGTIPPTPLGMLATPPPPRRRTPTRSAKKAVRSNIICDNNSTHVTVKPFSLPW